jgi:molybdopterin-containing oxidoreductase family membrane subunit
MLIGSFGLFMTLFLLFIRFLPVVAIAEIKSVMPEANPHPHEPTTGHGDYDTAATHGRVAHG